MYKYIITFFIYYYITLSLYRDSMKFLFVTIVINKSISDQFIVYVVTPILVKSIYVENILYN